MTAPLWGSESIPPEAIAITRCMTSGGMLYWAAASIYFSPITLSAIPIPPEADPVIPAKTLVVTAPLTSGFVNICETPSRTMLKPGSAAIIPPNPYSEAVFMVASKAPPMLILIPSLNLDCTSLQLYNMVEIIPNNRASSTDQIPVTWESSTFPKESRPMEEKSNPFGYHLGIIVVKNLLVTPTRISGTNAKSSRERLFEVLRFIE